MKLNRLLALSLSASTLCVFALEGAKTSSDGVFRTLKPKTDVSPAMRKTELEARARAMAADKAAIQADLKKVPSADKMEELKQALQQVHKAYGWEPKSQLVYGRRSIDPMIKGQDRMPANLLKAFVQLNEDLKARGTDLILLPLAPTPHFHAHTLVDGIGPEDEYYPGWRKMVLEMIEADLEVVDSIGAFRKQAENPVLVSWANDFHTGSTGRKLAAQALRERLQRYDFIRELEGNQSQWTSEVTSRTGASLPQRILVVNGAMMSSTEYWQKKEPGLKRWEAKKKGPVPEDAGLIVFKGKKGSSALRPDAPQEMIAALRKLTFQLVNLKFTGSEEALARTELAMIGDSQLHSAVYGSGLPEFIQAELGGRFRWGSKSWSGFSPPEIYREVVPDSTVQPRVVVLAFLPKYFWHSYDRQGKVNEEANKYKPRPLPPFKGTPAAPIVGGVVAAAAVPEAAGDDAEMPAELNTKVKFLQVSARPTDNPAELDYDEAIMHVSAEILEGPFKGREIGLRYWVLHGGRWTQAVRAKAGLEVPVGLTNWDQVIKQDRSLAQHQIFNDTEQDFLVPVFWATDGALSPDALLKR